MARFVFPRRRVAYYGTCPSGCWSERDANGRVYCVCGDTLLHGVLDNVPPVVKTLGTLALGAVAGWISAGWVASRR